MIAKLNVDYYQESDRIPPTVARGIIAGIAKNYPDTAVCMKVAIDSRPGMEAVNRIKVTGATGAATGLNGKGTFDPPDIEDNLVPAPTAGSLALAAKEGKKRKLSPACKKLLRKLPG